MSDYLTPSEILTKHTQLRTIWNNKQIGYLLNLRLVKGKKLQRTCLVDEQDVLNLYKFVKSSKK
ncbi:MAG: hypothetical protein KAT68_00645 [Bacteroidales bacterium]|nr:hypothetical protein [Bacteroidales bacterium]